jgi:hypothetical protein
MPKQEAKPIWRLLVVCYFLPLAIAFLLGSDPNSKPNMGFVLAIAAVALLSLVLFLKLRQWEYGWRRKAAQAQGEKTQSTHSAVSKVDHERYVDELKQKEEHIFRVTAEHRTLQHEKEELLQTHQATLQALQNEMETHKTTLQETIQRLQAELLDKQLHAQMQESVIAGLRTDISNLNFELRTLLKVESKKNF